DESSMSAESTVLYTSTAQQLAGATDLASPGVDIPAAKVPPMVISIDTTGNLRLGPQAKPVAQERFQSELLDAVSKNPDLKLAINADKGTPLSLVVKIMDAAKEARMKPGSVSLLTKATAQSSGSLIPEEATVTWHESSSGVQLESSVAGQQV